MKLHVTELAFVMLLTCANPVLTMSCDQFHPSPYTTQQPYEIGFITLTDTDHNTKA